MRKRRRTGKNLNSRVCPSQCIIIFVLLLVMHIASDIGLSMGAGPYGLPVGLPMGIPAKTLTCRSRLPVATGP
jgi:hypothetical protein